MSADGAGLTIPEPPMLRLGGRSFPCVYLVPQWQLMKLAKGMSGDDEMVGLAAMYDFLKALVAPDAWADFDAFMSTLDIEHTELDEAIGGALASMAGRGKESGAPSSPSSDGSPTTATPPVSRVVSLSRGTVVEEPRLSDVATSSGA